jgi:predicted adenine nucleotide alpha hydrolase (AANH) superfamily ATPase
MDNRCEICYSLRLEKAASFAADNGYQAFSTSLLISPYQKHEELKRAGEEAASRHGVSFLYRDFRPLFRESQENAKAMGLYMQKYCGCVFSEEERHLKKNDKKRV